MFKFDQIAYHVPNITKAQLRHDKLFGMKEWKRDIVKGIVSVAGTDFEPSVAELAFNYDQQFEYELLTYLEGPNWHGAFGRLEDSEGFPFHSHMGIHTQEIEEAKNKFIRDGLVVAQEMITHSHTNPYLIEKKRTYHYVIFDSRDDIGFDLKLIKRIGQ